MSSKRDVTGMRVLYGLTGVVGTVWVTSLINDMFNPAYNPPETVGLVFMVVVSTLLGVIATNTRRDKKDEDGEDH